MNCLNRKPQILNGITFGIDFMSDDEIRADMIDEYRFEEFVYSDDEAQKSIIRHAAEMIRDTFNERYRVLQLRSTYNPLENYNLTETETATRTGKVNTQSTGGEVTETTSYGDGLVVENSNPKSITQAFDYPVTSDAARIVSKAESQLSEATKQTTKGEVTNKTSQFLPAVGSTEYDNVTDTRNLNRHGNIGVTTSQRMLKSELELIYNLKKEYISAPEFSECFMIVM